MSALPATSFLIFFIAADFFETELSKANGPKMSAFIFSSFAFLVIKSASIELGTLSYISSVADRTETFGLEIPILFAKFTAFLRICILTSNLGNTLTTPSVIIKGLSSADKVMCHT